MYHFFVSGPILRVHSIKHRQPLNEKRKLVVNLQKMENANQNRTVPGKLHIVFLHVSGLLLTMGYLYYISWCNNINISPYILTLELLIYIIAQCERSRTNLWRAIVSYISGCNIYFIVHSEKSVTSSKLQYCFTCFTMFVSSSLMSVVIVVVTVSTYKNRAAKSISQRIIL